MSGCKIGKIRMKSGGAEIRVLPSASNNTVTLSVSGGSAEVVIRTFDGEPITHGAAVFMLEQAKADLLYE